MKNEIRIAVTSVGSGIGQSIVNSCRLSHLPIVLTGLDLSAMAYGAYDCDIQKLVPPVNSPDYLQAVLDICLAERIDLLIPGLDLELPLISKHVDMFLKNGIKVLIAGYDFITLCRDKVKWSRELHKISKTVVPCFDYKDIYDLLESGAVSLPLVAKPKGGSASAGVCVINSIERLKDIDDGYIIQPFVFPENHDPYYEPLRIAAESGRLQQLAEISVQYVISKEQEILGRMATYNKLKDGVPIEVTPIEDDRIWNAIDEFFPCLLEKGMCGPINIQGRMTADGPRFFEMNARFTGITGMRAMMGFNEVEALIKDFLDLPLASASLASCFRKVGLRQIGDRLVSPLAYGAMKRRMDTQAGYTGKNKNDVVLVTGASGWLGRHIVRALDKTGRVDTIIALVRNTKKAEEIFQKEAAERLQIVSLADYHDSSSIIGNVDTVVHCAAAREPEGRQAIAESLAFTQKLISDCALFQIPKFINISSQSVYGLSRPPLWHETTVPAPETAYAMAKLASECMVGALTQMSPTSLGTSIRLARLYGAAEGMRWSEVPNRFALQAVGGEEIQIIGGAQRFDLIHIEDAVDAIIRMVGADQKNWKPLYNLGCGGSIGITEIAAAAIQSARKMGLDKSWINLQAEASQMQFGMNTDRFCTDFAWKPLTSLTAAMDGIVRYALEYANSGKEMSAERLA